MTTNDKAISSLETVRMYLLQIEKLSTSGSNHEMINATAEAAKKTLEEVLDYFYNK